MTDTTRGEILATPAAAATRSREGYLFSPWIDFLGLGGLAIISLPFVLAFAPKGLSPAVMGVVVLTLMTVINQPHFAHSYQIFYSNFREKAFGQSYSPDLRRRYIFSGLIAPALLIAFFAMSFITDDAKLLSYGANLMFFLVGWHYVKQGYGILMLDSAKKKLFYSDQAKLLFRVNGYACWIVAWMLVNHAIAQAVPYLGITYYTFDLPTLAYYGVCAFAAVTTVLTLFTLLAPKLATPLLAAVQNAPKLLNDRDARHNAAAAIRAGAAETRLANIAHTTPWNGVMAYLTVLYLWVVFVRINPLFIAIVPTFHSLQYLVVVWRYEINATQQRAEAGHRSAVDRLERLVPSALWRRVGAFVLFGVFLGFLGFYGLPRGLDAVMPYDHKVFGPAMFLFMFYIFINVHHYFLDNVMWRRGNPDVRKYLFAK